MDSYSNFVSEQKSKLKIELIGEKKNDDLYSGWEINKISSEFNEIYYKSELIRTIENLIKNGTNPSDIWIMNKSIDIKKKYVNYNTGSLNLSNSKNIEYLYFLGSPTPLYTNRSVILTSIAFDAFRIVYTICNKHNIVIPKRAETLSKIIQDIDSNQLTNLIDYFKKIVFDTNNFKDRTLKSLLNSELNRNLRISSENFEEILHKELNDNIVFPKNFKKYDNFNSIFNSYERPVVIVNNSSNSNLQSIELSILCYDFLVSEKFKKNNPRFLETNLISQQSPLVYAITLGLTITPSLILILRQRMNLISIKREKFEAETGHNAEISALDSELASLNARIEELDRLNSINENNFTNYMGNLNNSAAAQDNNNKAALTMIDTNKKINAHKGVEWLKQNNLKMVSLEKTDIEP